jgi:O6-methylguanine-DNA--protein-cysteine methyltransferase
MGIGWIGWSGSVTDQSAIGQIVLPGLPMPPGKKAQPTPGVVGMALRLTRYFDGSGEWPSGAKFIDSAAATPFEAAVYRAVTAIPPGNTMTYADVASQVGHPVGTDGSLRGYAGGIAMKRHLLEVEAAGA